MKRVLLFAVLTLASLRLYSAHNSIFGVWKAKTFELELKRGKSLEIRIHSGAKITIKGYWNASKKYLYLEYFSLLKNGIKNEYYKTMVFEILKLGVGELAIRNPYTLKITLLKR